MLAVVEPIVASQGAEERLLEGVFRPLPPESAPQQPEHLILVLEVEGLEGRDAARRAIIASNAAAGRSVRLGPRCESPSSGTSSGSGSRGSNAIPATGEIAHSTEDWEEVGGGGAVAAIQLAQLAGEATLFTALGDDELGRRSLRGTRGAAA